MGAINKFFSNMLNKDEDEENVYDDVEDVEEDDDGKYYKSKSYDDDYSRSKVIPVSNSMSGVKMVITQPTCYEDVQEIGDYFKEKKSVIINLETVNKEEARRILDFMSGATFICEGTIQKVSNLIYLITPKNIEIQNDVEKTEYSKQKMSFSWMK